MSDELEIWYSWNGKGSPPIRVVSVIYNCGNKLGHSGKLKSSDQYNGWQWDQVKIPWQKIVAYTLGQTK